MGNFAAYDAATGCTQYPDGAKALAAYLEDRFPYQWSMGICNCRQVVGGSSWSHHAECRAYDCGLPTKSDGTARTDLGMPIVNLLIAHGKRLGIDHIIYNRRIWSASSPEGRYYGGTHPHYNHIHIGINTNAGKYLDYATLVAVLGPVGGEDQVIDRNSPKKSPAVAMFQRDLISLGYDLGDWEPIQPGLYPPGADGGFGDDAEAGTKEFQADLALAVTGKGDALTVALAANLARFNAQKISDGATADATARKAAAAAHARADAAYQRADSALAKGQEAHDRLDGLHSI